jgi:hypothetical protein
MPGDLQGDNFNYIRVATCQVAGRRDVERLFVL